MAISVAHPQIDRGVCKICEPASHTSHRASQIASHANHSTNVKNFYLFYLHLHDNILDEFFTRAVSRHELRFRSRYQNSSSFFIFWGCDGPRDKTLGHELSSRACYLYSGVPKLPHFFFLLPFKLPLPFPDVFCESLFFQIKTFGASCEVFVNGLP